MPPTSTSPRPTRPRFPAAVRAQQVTAEARPAWFKVGALRNEVVGDQGQGPVAARTSADVYVYDDIGGWMGVGADDFVRDVAGLEVDHIDLHLNSPGGSAWDGVAIANVLRQHKADVTVWVDGIAASAASVVAMAGDEVVMSVGAQLMIHDAWAYAGGDAAEMRKGAEMLDSMSDSIAATYAARAGGAPAQWRTVMQAETWYTADEAVTAGLADRVATAADNGSASGEQIVPGSNSYGFWDMWDSLADPARHVDAVAALYAHAGRASAPTPAMPGRRPLTPTASAAGSITPTERSLPVSFTDAQLTEMRQSLGIAEDADEGTILSALNEALAERAEGAPAEASGVPEGTSLVENRVLADLRNAADLGRQAFQRQQGDDRAALVTAAIADGRIAPASRESWLSALQATPEATATTLGGLAKGLLPTGQPAGHADDVANSDPRQSAASLNWSLR